ncbi:MAG: adenylate/guanylate cyclase domain-containing protein [Pseudomonadota bacterium]
MASVGSVILYLRSQSQQAIVESVIDRAELTVAALVRAVEGTLGPAEEQADFVARLIGDGVLTVGEPSGLEPVLLAALSPAPQILEIGVARDGDHIVAFRAPRALDQVESSGEESYGFQTFDGGDNDTLDTLIDQSVETGQSFWSPVLYDRRRQISSLVYVVPAVGPEADNIVVYSAVSTLELSHSFSEISDLFQATAFMLDAQERVVAHPNLVRDDSRLSADRPSPDYREIDDPILARYRDARPDPGVQGELLEVAGFEILSDLDGEPPQTFILTELDGYGARSWLIGSHFFSGELTGGLKQINDSGYLGGVMLLVSLLVGVVLARRLAGPIKRLAENAAKIGTLDLQRVERLPGSRITELNDQAIAFNAMVDGLKWFERYVPRSLVKRLIGRGEDEALASVDKQVTVLFTDLVGFTSQSETMTAGETADLLNHHFALLGEIIEAEAGTIDKFIGDALMAFWGAPTDQPDHADRAVRAGAAMVSAIERDNADRKARALPAIRVRIGIHTGPAVVGNIGAPGRMNYTIVGDTVNVGQRLESLGKEVNPRAEVSLLISGETRSALKGSVALKRVGAYSVKGRSNTVDVWQLAELDRPNAH